jgi:hypothetical protein
MTEGIQYLAEVLVTNSTIEFLSLPRNKLKYIEPILQNIMQIQLNDKDMESFR